MLCKVTSVVSDSVRPHRWQPTRLPHLWDSPGKNTGVGCHFLLQCMKVKSESEVAQSCPTLSDPMDCSLTSSSVHEIFQARGTGVGCHCLLCQYSILMHMEFRKMVTIILYGRQQKRHRRIEQSFGLCERGRGWDGLGEWHWNMYIIICEVNRQSRFDAWYRMLRAGALGWPRGMVWGGRWVGGSGWGTPVHPWQIHDNVWQTN